MFNLFRGFVFLWLSCIGIVHAADTGWLVSPQNDHARIRVQAEREQNRILALLTVELQPLENLLAFTRRGRRSPENHLACWRNG